MLLPAPQLAVYAEFRQDWSTAVAHYREAYAAILNVQVGCAGMHTAGNWEALIGRAHICSTGFRHKAYGACHGPLLV